MPAFNRDDAFLARNPIAWLRQVLSDWGLESFCKRYYGTYPGVVVDNADPEGLYRIRALCPAIGLNKSEGVPENYWAWPCLPGLGNDQDGLSGGDVWVPDVGSNVWLQFEGGSPKSPIYMGGWVNVKKAMPELDHAAALRKGIRTRSGHFLRFSDDPADLHITIGKGDGAGSQTASFLTFDKDGNVAISNDKGSLLYMNAQDDEVSVVTANADGETESIVMLGKDEVTLATKGGATFGMKGKDITINGGNIILNGTMVHLATKQIYLGKNATEPAVLGNKLALNMALQIHGTAAPGSPTTPPTTPPPLLGKELSTVVFIE
jgi:hypothetical protein